MLPSRQVKMVNEAAEAKVRFLEASARHYASSAPATSAHLMAQRNIEANERGVVSTKTRPGGSCKACGSILVPGWTSRTSIVRKGGRSKAALKKKKKLRKNASDLLKYLRIDCLLCYRYEERLLHESMPKSKDGLKTLTRQAVIGSEPQHPSSQTHDSSAAPTSQVQASQPLATNTSSKKRAKARKQGGLQAMLEKSKASTGPSSGFGLDLLDLMKAE